MWTLTHALLEKRRLVNHSFWLTCLVSAAIKRARAVSERGRAEYETKQVRQNDWANWSRFMHPPDRRPDFVEFACLRREQNVELRANEQEFPQNTQSGFHKKCTSEAEYNIKFTSCHPSGMVSQKLAIGNMILFQFVVLRLSATSMR